MENCSKKKRLTEYQPLKSRTCIYCGMLCPFAWEISSYRNFRECFAFENPLSLHRHNRDTFGASHMRRLSRVNLSAMQTYVSDFNDQRQIRKKAYHRFFQDASIFLHTTYICLSMMVKRTFVIRFRYLLMNAVALRPVCTVLLHFLVQVSVPYNSLLLIVSNHISVR